jgi:hypothetical protein
MKDVGSPVPGQTVWQCPDCNTQVWRDTEASPSRGRSRPPESGVSFLDAVGCLVVVILIAWVVFLVKWVAS